MTNNQFKEITNIINNLERKGLFKQADSLNNILIKIAQQIPDEYQIDYYQKKINQYKQEANNLYNQTKNIYSVHDFINNFSKFDRGRLTEEQFIAFEAQGEKIEEYIKNRWVQGKKNQAYEDTYIYKILRHMEISTPDGKLNPEITSKSQLSSIIDTAKELLNDKNYLIKIGMDKKEIEDRDMIKSLDTALDKVYNIFSIRLPEQK
jgi:hypothetical protein